MGRFQPDKGGIGVAINNVITPGFNQRFGLAHNVVPAHGDGRRQTRIKEAAGAGAQHPVKGVHNDFQRL